MGKKAAKKGKGGGRRGKPAPEDTSPKHEMPYGFWAQIIAIIMLAVSVFLVLSWFNRGGALLAMIFSAGYRLIGIGYFFLPPMIVYLAVLVFRSSENKIPKSVFAGSFLMLVWLACAGAILPHMISAFPSDGGGLLGGWVYDALVGSQVFSPGVALFGFILAMLITELFILKMSPSTLLKKLSGKKEKKEAVGKTGSRVDLSGEAKEEESKPEEKKGWFGGKKDKKTDLAVRGGAGAVAGAAAATASVTPKIVAPTNWRLPSLELLDKKQTPADAGNIQQNAQIIKNTFEQFGIDVKMDGADVGPRVTRYTLRPPSGVNLSRIIALDRELSLNLAVDKVRIEAPIAGTSLVGIELPNVRQASVGLRSVLDSPEWKASGDALTFALGKNISGAAVTANLAKMPHLLIAGTTGSGKSVASNVLITSLLYRNSPDRLRMIIVDPKQVEMSQYRDIPHLETPIITKTEDALTALKWVATEMDRRYSLMSKSGSKKIDDYNTWLEKKIEEQEKAGTKERPIDDNFDPTPMPYLVVLIDEMADLMMQSGKDMETNIVRVAQKGRAAGIHLVLATQRPEVKVVTGLIKANVPGRIAFAVSNQVDSRVMIDASGAEKLLGQGDGLLLTTEMMGKPVRIQGAFVSDNEVDAVVKFLKSQGEPRYNEEVMRASTGEADKGSVSTDLTSGAPSEDAIAALNLFIEKNKVSTSMLQTFLRMGHGRAARAVHELEARGAVAPDPSGRGKIVTVTSIEELI
ncbi:FtsK/SpoIIIE domain-containing protein [Candidatus Saccharibacteria bacterium]|nr:FtsK/SpoIIIE domain-containing protein [Candidatus Saccharibacteria bacterium]